MSDPTPGDVGSSRRRRSTRQRAAISRALGETDRFRTAQELHADLSAAGERVGLTTIYRELQRLVDAGQIDTLTNPAGEAMYRRCATDEHHHHLVCRSCGRSVEVASDEVEEWASRTAASHGFTSPSHVTELYGVCSGCRPGRGAGVASQ